MANYCFIELREETGLLVPPAISNGMVAVPISLPILRQGFANSVPMLHESSVAMPNEVIEILSSEEVRRTVTRMASEVIERSGDLAKLVLLGVYTRGVDLAHMLARQIELLEQVSVPLGAIDITFYRDDLDAIGIRTPAKTDIPFDLSGKTVVLVDDVIFKGRTARAALEAIKDYGRPTVVRLAVLVDRGHRELPIHPDFTGKLLPTAREETVKVYVQALDGRDSVELIKG